ncbi:hypothetical protein [Allobaculum mucilyticum]|nr:hypothetical protein [Allobaculum mucilyticum]UNT95020.1 hypothetical protein KWG62_06480 [Allobaculum mucilyticum]
MNLFDLTYSLSDRKLRMLESGWPGYFNRVIIPELVKLESILSLFTQRTPTPDLQLLHTSF